MEEGRKEYPKIYVRFEGKPDLNGHRRKYWVQDFTEEYIEKVIDDFTWNFLRDEILFGSSGVYEDQGLCDLFKVVQDEVMRKKMSLICLTEDADGKIHVAGLNSLYLCKKDDDCVEKYQVHVKTVKPMMIINYICNMKDPYKELGITEFVKALGLYVAPKFRKEGVGQQLINARELLCRDFGVKTSITFFSSFISQKVAENAGFKDLVIVPYAEVPEVMFIPNVHTHTKYGRYMYRFYD